MDLIITVDENDNITGEEEKEKCHDANGILHRAFLVIIFNEKGEVLLAQRSNKKRLWPLYWDGTVASHIRKGETYEQAAVKRLYEELGISADNLNYITKFRYNTNYKNIGTENEICAIFLLKDINDTTLKINYDEISQIKSVNLNDIKKFEDELTPWFLIALEELKKGKKN